MRTRLGRGTLPLAALPALLLIPGPLLPAAEAARAEAGKNIGAAGTLISREAPGKPWHGVGHDEKLYTGDLIVGPLGAELASKDGAVRVLFLGDIDHLSPFPILEAAVQLHQTAGYDLDLTLDRGRIDLINQKEKGPARVRLRVRDKSCDFTLAEPGTRLILELYGGWPKGVRFTTKPGPKDVPALDLIALVAKGDVEIKHEDKHFAMSAPPGSALIRWSTEAEEAPVPQSLKELPPWALPAKPSERAQRAEALVKRFGELIMSKGLHEAEDEFLNSDDELQRGIAMAALAATDDLSRLGQVLMSAKHHEDWERGVRILRHWLGRGPGQDMKLYERLIEVRKMPPKQAATVVQLLHSFSEEEEARPELYETLIGYLGNDVLAIRGLAYWHLVRLVPAGRGLGYDPFASKEERENARKKWQELIPPGKMPPKPEKK
jgi:hypothetical protein